MLKIIAPGSYKFDQAALSLIKMSQRGLIGSDLKYFIKRAGDEAAHRFSKLSFGPGEIPVHLIALGTTESIGCNRNGDGFKEATCRKFHPTFVKYARWYRNHANKDTQKSYGVVKDSFFNEPMHRVELIVGWNGTKEAADRNHGLVADKEQEKLAKGDDVPVSMACKVAYDVCSGCGNKARTKEDYCDEKMCVKYGGLQDNMARVFEDGHVLHADNPEPCFFDISGVYRPADRIAYVLGKMACDAFSTVGGAQLAEELGISAPLEVLASVHQHPVAEQMQALSKLASAESQQYSAQDLWGIKAAGSVFDGVQIPKVCSAKMYSMLKALTREKIALALPDFLRLLGVRQELLEKTASDVAPLLPDVYNRLVEDREVDEKLTRNPYRTNTAIASENDKKWASKLASQFSLNRESIRQRAWLQSLHQNAPRVLTKVASNQHNVSNDAERFFAEQYALYKLAFLADTDARDDELTLTANLLVMHNNTW